MSKQHKQAHQDGFKKAKAHLQQSWWRWLDGQGTSSSSSQRQATASKPPARERGLQELLGVWDVWGMTR